MNATTTNEQGLHLLPGGHAYLTVRPGKAVAAERKLDPCGLPACGIRLDMDRQGRVVGIWIEDWPKGA